MEHEPVSLFVNSVGPYELLYLCTCTQTFGFKNDFKSGPFEDMNGEFMQKKSLAFIHLGILLSDKDPLVECR